MPEEVRKWLASTFAKQESAPKRRPEERPSFRSVANAIRTGIFIEKIYRRMSSSQLMVIPPEVQHVLRVCDWNSVECIVYTHTQFPIGMFSKYENIKRYCSLLLGIHVNCIHRTIP